MNPTEKILDNRLFFALAEEQLAAGRQVRLTLRGSSMEPTLREGDVLTLLPARGGPEVGQVVLFRHEGRHLLHRVVALADDGFVAQGDHCFGCEQARRADLLAVLGSVERRGRTLDTADPRWQRQTRRALRRGRTRRVALRWLGRDGRRRLRPWYFAVLAFLMWAPLNRFGDPHNVFILGLRADHLLHASVYLPCALFLADLFPRRRWLAWLCGLGVGVLTESVQWLLPYRGFDINDMVANALGVTFGWLALWLVRRR